MQKERCAEKFVTSDRFEPVRALCGEDVRLTGQEPLHGTITMFAGQYEERLIVYGVEPIEATRACPLAELTASRSFWLDDTSLL